jgi:transposase
VDTNDSLYTDPEPCTEPVANAEPTKSVQRRRKFSTQQKRRIVEDALASGESISIAARRHNINTNLLFKCKHPVSTGLPSQLIPPR